MVFNRVKKKKNIPQATRWPVSGDHRALGYGVGVPAGVSQGVFAWSPRGPMESPQIQADLISSHPQVPDPPARDLWPVLFIGERPLPREAWPK